jgi:hypothetical protein
MNHLKYLIKEATNSGLQKEGMVPLGALYDVARGTLAATGKGVASIFPEGLRAKLNNPIFSGDKPSVAGGTVSMAPTPNWEGSKYVPEPKPRTGSSGFSVYPSSKPIPEAPPPGLSGLALLAWQRAQRDKKKGK